MASLAEVLKRVSYSEIARRSGTTPGYISLLFRGKRSARMETLAKVAKVLGVGVGELHDYLTKSPRKPQKRAA
jgi:transcriptional regulator with XRE-family HTH domain